MKAIVLKELGGPEKLLWEEVADPVPGAGEVLVRLKAAALNHRDAWIRKGLYANIQLPTILGSDGSGEVSAVGSGVSTDLLGQAVVINPCLDWGPEIKAQGPGMRILGMPDNGTYAQMVVVPAANIRPKPAHLSFEEATALPLAGMTAYRALVTRARVTAGETVLITGVGGGVASLALQIAHCLGARTFVTSGSDHKIERARALGAAGGVNYRDEQWSRKLRQLLQGRPLDVIIDGSGGSVFERALALIGPAGRIVTYGATLGAARQIEVRRIFWKQVTVMGSTMASPQEFDALVQLCSAHGLRPPIDRVFPLKEAGEAHQRMEDAKQFGKILLGT